MYHIITECLVGWPQSEKFYGIENAMIRALNITFTKQDIGLRTNQFQPHFSPLYLAKNQRFHQVKNCDIFNSRDSG